MQTERHNQSDVSVMGWMEGRRLIGVAVTTCVLNGAKLLADSRITMLSPSHHIVISTLISSYMHHHRQPRSSFYIKVVSKLKQRPLRLARCGKYANVFVSAPRIDN